MVIVNLPEIANKLRKINFKEVGKKAPALDVPPIRYKPADLPEEDRNNVIGKDDVLVVKGAIARLQTNMEAILLLRQLMSENRNPTAKEKKVLQRFVGWGGISEIFKAQLSNWHKEFVEKLLSGSEAVFYNVKLPPYSLVGKSFDRVVQDVIETAKTLTSWSNIDLATARHAVVRYLLSTFDDLAYQNAVNSTINAHYTSRTVIEQMWALLEKVGFQGGNILENSAGIGHFLGLMPPKIAERSVLYAVEKDTVSGHLLEHLYPQAEVQITGFENAELPLGAFDLVLGNVPFGKSDLVNDLTFKHISRFALHNYFMAKSLIALRPGGLCFVITSHSTMDNGDVPENENESTRINSYDFRKWADSANEGNADFLGAIRLPNNAFLDNANTEVVTDIILLRKRESNTPHPLAQTWLGLEKVGEGKYLPTAEDKQKIEKKKIKETDLPTKVDIKVNEYYAQNPFMMLGKAKLQHESNAGRMYNDANRQTIELDNPQEFPILLTKAFKTFEEYLGKVYVHNPNLSELVNTGVAMGQLGEYLVLPDNKPYKIVRVPSGSSWTKGYEVLENFKTPKDVEMLREYADLKTTLKRLLILEQNETEESNATASKRQELNKKYNDFLKSFGYINKHKRLLREEADWYLMGNLEIFKPKTNTYDKAQIFSKKIAFSFPVPEKAQNIEDAVEISLNYRGKLDTNYIANLLGLSEESAVYALLNTEVESFVEGKRIVQPLAFINPRTGLLEEADAYLSGNVRQKLVEAREYAEKEPRFAINVKHLEANQAEWLPINKISYGLQSPWIPTKYVVAFAKEILKADIDIERHVSDLRLHVSLRYVNRFHPSSSPENIRLGLVVRNRKSQYDIIRNGVPETVEIINNDVVHYATDLIEALMGNKRPTIWRNKVDDSGNVIYKEDKYGKQYAPQEVDEHLTGELQRKMFELNTVFRSYVISHKEVMQDLEKIYNDVYNESIERVWRVPKITHFPGANPDITLRDHQKRGVKRALQEAMGGFYGVGTGKTYTIITTAMEMRRLGIAKKPLIVVQNATLEQFIAQARKLYPTAKILSPTINEVQSIKAGDTDAVKLQKVQMARAQRMALFAQIRFGDWDMIILPQSQFELIPDSPSRMRKLLVEKLQELEWQLDSVDDTDNGLKSRLRGQIKQLEEQIQEQDVRIAEEWQTQKTEEAKQKDRTVKDKARAALRIEAKLTQQLDRKTDKVLNFEELGIDALFIDEAHAYKRLGFDTNLTDVKGIDTAYSKRAMSTYLKITWIYEMLKAERNVSMWTGTPISNTMAEMWTMTRFLRPSVLKRKYIHDFDSFAGAFAMVENSFEMDAGGRYKTVARLTRFDNMPELLNIWKSFADVVIGQEVLGKANNVEDADYIEAHKNNYQNQTPLLALQPNGTRGYTNIIINKSPAQRRQVLAFQQLLNWFDKVEGMCKKNNAHIPLVVFGRAKQATIDLRLLPDFINVKNVDCFPRPGASAGVMHNEFDEDNKLFACAENVFRIYKRDKANPTAQLVFCDTFRRVALDYANRNSKGEPKEIEVFNVYRELKRILVEKGIPEHEIAIITDHENNRLPLYTKVRNAEIRVLIGSTQKMGVGVDVQDRLVALHHIDAPMRPMDFEQRNGRIIRQGNMNAVVEIFTYGIEGTLDAVAYSRLKQKQEFINQMMKGSLKDRSMQDSFDDEGDADFYAMLSSMLTGSTTAVDLLKVKKDLIQTKNRIEFEQAEASKLVSDRGKAEIHLAEIEASLKKLAIFEEAIKEDFPETEAFNIKRLEYGSFGYKVWDTNTTKTVWLEKQDKDGKPTKVEKQEKVKLSEALAELLAYYEPQVIDYFRQGIKSANQQHDYKTALSILTTNSYQENFFANGFLMLLNFYLKPLTGVSAQKYPYRFSEPFAGNNTEFEIRLEWNVIFENELLLRKPSYLDLSLSDIASKWQRDIHTTFRGTSEDRAYWQQAVEKEQHKIAYLTNEINNPKDLNELKAKVPELTKKVSELERKLKVEQELDMREAMQNSGLQGFTHNAHFVRLGSLDMAFIEPKETIQALIGKLSSLEFSQKTPNEPKKGKLQHKQNEIEYLIREIDKISDTTDSESYKKHKQLKSSLYKNAQEFSTLYLDTKFHYVTYPHEYIKWLMEQNLAKWAMIGKFELDRHFVKNDLYSGLTGKSKAPIRQAILKELTGKELPASKVSINLVFDSLMNWYDKNFAENGLSGVDWQNISFTIEESKHTKTGEAIWLIKFDKIKNYDDFKALEKRVKPIAYYSKFVKAFVAKNEVTEADVRAVLGSGGASAPSPTRTQTPKKLINFESGKTRRDIVRKEVEAGKMLSARYKYFNGMIDMYEYVPFKDMVWEDANNKYVLDYLKNYRVTIDSKDRTVSLEDYYWLVYKDDFEAMKAYHEEAVRKNKAEQVLQELLRSRVLSVDKYKQLVETQPYYLLNWRDLYDLHKALLEYAYQDDQYNFYGLISDKGVLANLVAFMYEGDLWEAIKEDMKRAEQDLPTNQRNFAEALQDANKYGKKIWHIKTNTIDLEELTEKLSSLNFTTPLSGTTTLFPKFKGELDIIE